MDGTKIEWTDATWNPIRGCSRVSEGCRNCYAERVAARFSGPPSIEREKKGLYYAEPYHGLAEMTPAGPRWTGKVELVNVKLEDPIRWKKPRRIFVNSMSDLFHESVSEDWIAQIFSVMGAAPRHTFQVLTKRAERMRTMFASPRWAAYKPLPNVWLGVSVENQAAADKRIPLLLDTPAAVRWISAEPLLGPLDLDSEAADGLHALGCGWEEHHLCKIVGLNWIVVGGESGPGARPFCIDWADDIVRQARTAGVPVFVKQLGSKPVTENMNLWDMDAAAVSFARGAAGAEYKLADKKGGDMAEWPEELRVREFPAIDGVKSRKEE